MILVVFCRTVHVLTVKLGKSYEHSSFLTIHKVGNVGIVGKVMFSEVSFILFIREWVSQEGRG